MKLGGIPLKAMLPAIAFNVLFLIKVIIGSTWITFLGWIVLMVFSFKFTMKQLEKIFGFTLCRYSTPTTSNPEPWDYNTASGCCSEKAEACPCLIEGIKKFFVNSYTLINDKL